MWSVRAFGVGGLFIGRAWEGRPCTNTILSTTKKSTIRETLKFFTCAIVSPIPKKFNLFLQKKKRKTIGGAGRGTTFVCEVHHHREKNLFQEGVLHVCELEGPVTRLIFHSKRRAYMFVELKGQGTDHVTKHGMAKHQTDITTYRQNQPRGRCCEIHILDIFRFLKLRH